MPEPSHRRRKIPWLDVVKHHKEITRRAEEDFFSLPVAQTDSERWSSILSSSPNNFAEQWTFPLENIMSAGMQRNIQGGNTTEFFIGCGCWHTEKNVKINDKWVTSVDWRPAIYKQVEIRVDDEIVTIEPAQGKWEFSPLVFALLDKKSSCPAQELDEWLPQLLESAFKNHESSGKDISFALIEVLSRDLPALGEELQKTFPRDKIKQKPTQWILFTAPASISAVNQHLMADYKRIEIRLEKDPKDIGGLRLYEDIKSVIDEKDIKLDQQIDLLPIVALNESQRVAVCSILQGKPVTVISGPPGCGKSQVVVSALLNAWAIGMTVVFASNNNQAVNVVRERIKRFEDDFPIAIRAGSNRESNLVEALRQTLNVVDDNGKKSGSAESAKNQKKMSETRGELQRFIESKVPQKVDQSLRSALNAFANYLEVKERLNEKDDSVRKSLLNMQYKIKAESFEAEILNPLQNWLDEIDDLRLSILTTEQQRTRLEAETIHTKTLRDVACQRVGLESQYVTSWEWLISGPDPEILRGWRDKFRDILNKPLENNLEFIAWEEVYDRWNGSAEVKKWITETSKFISDMRIAINRLAPLTIQINETKIRYTAQQQVMREAGNPENVSIDNNLMMLWMSLFAEHTTSIKSTFDWLPWSKFQKRERQLQQLEKQLRPVFPVSIWQKIGTLNNEGRSTLALLLEKYQVWIETQRQWNNLANSMQDVENTYFQLRSYASNQNITNAPIGSNTTEWQNFESGVVKLISVAENAERAWRKKEEKYATIALLLSLVMDFDAYASGVPLKEEWRKGRGVQLDIALKSLANNPSAETLVAARTALYTAPLDDLLTCWETARQNETTLRKLIFDLSNLPTNESLVETWWRKHPKQLPITLVKYPRIPELGDPLFEHLSSCVAWQKVWEEFLNFVKPDFQKTINEGYVWAYDGLSKVSELLTPEYSERARALVKKVLADSNNIWPTDELLNVFSEFTPEAIKARIEGIDHKLEGLSFTFARDEWIGRLCADIELQDTLTELLRNFERKRGRIEETDYKLFRKSLKAVPIWITTAQATQSIPLLPDLFDLLIIDEATQCTVTNLLPLVYRAKHIAVIGDKEQLEPIPSMSPAAEAVLATGFGIEHLLDLIGHTKNNVYGSFVQCLPKRYSDIIALDEHYRSHPLIIGFANEHIYKKRLRLRKDPNQGVKIPTGAGIFCRNIVGFCTHDRRGDSWQNQNEAQAVLETIKQLRAESQSAHFTLGVVTPFKAQAKLITEMVTNEGLQNILVGTAHSFQGDERDVIIFSPVISNGIKEGAAMWVEKPPNLINVAVTRAREALFIVGNLLLCRQQPGILGKLAVYAEQVELLRNTSKQELELFSWMVIQGWAPEVHPVIGDNEVDFVLQHEGRKLVIEVDGTQHEWSTVVDNVRDAYLKSNGYMVIRIQARAIHETPAVCIEKIENILISAL